MEATDCEGERKSTSLTSVFSLQTSVFLLPYGTTLMDIHTENTDVREVGFHPPPTVISTITSLPGGDVMSLSGLLDDGSHSMPEYGGDHLGRRPKRVLFRNVAKLFWLRNLYFRAIN